jgi:hypothetical protein
MATGNSDVIKRYIGIGVAADIGNSSRQHEMVALVFPASKHQDCGTASNLRQGNLNIVLRAWSILERIGLSQGNCVV